MGVVIERKWDVAFFVHYLSLARVATSSAASIKAFV